MTTVQSALYFGRVVHHRTDPVHRFSYRLWLAYLDLSELPEVFAGRFFWSARRPAPAWFRRRDYLGDRAVPLDTAVRDCVHEQTGHRPKGPIRMLTQLRMFGFCFNPVTFYYCFDETGSFVDTLVAEITNTPWHERHAYVLPAAGSLDAAGVMTWCFKKRFHVSPFFEMALDYRWRFTVPGQQLRVHMEDHRKGERIFDAHLTMERRPITGRTLALALMRHPATTWKVFAAIYWQALRLKLKGARFHAHPGSGTQEAMRLDAHDDH